MSLADLSSIVGVTRQAVSKWELNKALPNSSMIIKIADATGKNPAYFFENRKPIVFENSSYWVNGRRYKVDLNQ